MRIRLKTVNISSFSDISVLMNIRHSHRSIHVNRFLMPFIRILTIIKCLLIESSCVCYVITSLVDCKIISIYSRPRVNFVEHKIVWPEYLLNKSGIICSLKFTRISTISKYWLWRIVVHVYSELEFCNIIWYSEVFSAKRIQLII